MLSSFSAGNQARSCLFLFCLCSDCLNDVLSVILICKIPNFSIPVNGSDDTIRWHPRKHIFRFIPSCEGQTLSVYAAFSRLKHLVVQFAQMPFSTRHTSFSLHIIYRKNIFFAIFPNIFLYFFNPHSVFIVYNNFFTFTHTVIFCVYLYIFKDSCFRPAEILKIFNF